MTFNPEDMRSGSLSRYLNDDTEDRRDRASGLGKYLPSTNNADDED